MNDLRSLLLCKCFSFITFVHLSLYTIEQVTTSNICACCKASARKHLIDILIDTTFEITFDAPTNNSGVLC